ncbi:ankyrin repeat and sterile alpha motif domain-containing protein 1B-like [Trichosurus vulpecula]|uniref:ankyrin repeat and sterile alpha motif domain-containing protein 1B-like n=1 Tax=Trichosurus vulpecula TaxID=9337 RepID=UPI00186AD35E|nr:ankyrin repeat and sterile alpha motif domain-containing protein 1B-like [Trichosurus vulpecula]
MLHKRCRPALAEGISSSWSSLCQQNPKSLQYPHVLNTVLAIGDTKKHLADPCQQEENDPPEDHDPGQFAGLLHGSSPACESPDNPLRLYSKANMCGRAQEEISLMNNPVHYQQPPPGNNPGAPVKKIKPKVVSRTIFHTKSHPLENHTLVGTRTARNGTRNGNGDQWGVSTGGFVERACTLGRIRSLPKALLDLHLSKNVSKSDSDLIAYPSTEKTSRVNWSESSTTEPSSKGNSERTPSFTSEWEEIDKIMSSIDAGINNELEEMNDDITRRIGIVEVELESENLPSSHTSTTRDKWNLKKGIKLF